MNSISLTCNVQDNLCEAYILWEILTDCTV